MTKLVAIVGPTCSAKSDIGMVLAERLGGEIVSADSRQIYTHLDIGTSKPSAEDRNKVRHHFVDILEPTEEYSAGVFGHDARKCIEAIIARGKQPILIGGSGLYVKAVIDGFFDGPQKDPELRSELEERLKSEGQEALFATLKRVDPISASSMDSTKTRRVIRALEVYYKTGKPLSAHFKEQGRSSWLESFQYGIDRTRQDLYERINGRVDAMLSRGLVEEVKRLISQGYSRSLNALNSVGYKEVFEYLENVHSYEEMVEDIKRNTRRFAKRQLTWFRADRRIQWIRADSAISPRQIAMAIEKRINPG